MYELLQELEKERETLVRAIAKQSLRGYSGRLPDAVLAQSQRLDRLIAEVQRASADAKAGVH